MAEHDERNFEHEFSEKLKKLDSSIKIPEIPDAQSIFEKAEEKKENTVPFKKYSKYIAAAAAVVLICVSIPVMADALSVGFDAASFAANEEREFNNVLDEYTAESVEQQADDENKFSEPEEAQMDGDAESSSASSSYGLDDGAYNYSTTNAEAARETLYDFFKNFANDGSPSAGSSSDLHIEVDDEKDNSVNGSSQESVPGDDLSYIEDYINKKRSIELTVEKDSVSVLLRDNSAEEEIITAFWIEGTYQGSYLDGDYYVINLEKAVDPDEIADGHYLPMVGDVYGTYYISEKDIFVPDAITRGVIALAVEIHVGTGEYTIYASLV